MKTEEIKIISNEKRRINLNNLLVACCQSPSPPHSPPPIEPRSKREIEVLSLIAEGLSNREIAQKLVLPLPTIKWHTSNIYGKLGGRDWVTAVSCARDLHSLPDIFKHEKYR